MAISVRIPASLRTLTQGKEEITATGANVGALIDSVESQFPGVKERLIDAKGVKRFMNVYLNEDDIRFLESLETAVKDGDTLTIVPAIAGGR